jgi:glycosyltransferase involved in cell wall biosynthesis
MSKLVTVCIPTFNSEATIAETLDSLVNQSYKNLRVIIFDNFSSDNTVKVVERYHSKFKKFEVRTSEENIGAEGNFTRCLAVDDSDYTAIFHADDIYDFQMIEKQVHALEENSDLLAVSTHSREIDLNGKVIGERFLPSCFKDSVLNVLNFESLLEVTLKYGNIVTCPSVLARTRVYSEYIRNWDGENYRSSADLDVWFRVAQLGKFGILSPTYMSYRVADVSTSYRMKKSRVMRHDMFLVLDKYFQVSEHPSLIKYYNFLNLKDLALRVYNGSGEKLSPWKREYFQLALEDSWHRLFFIKVLAIWVLNLFKFNR